MHNLRNQGRGGSLQVGDSTVRVNMHVRGIKVCNCAQATDTDVDNHMIYRDIRTYCRVPTILPRSGAQAATLANALGVLFPPNLLNRAY